MPRPLTEPRKSEIWMFPILPVLARLVLQALLRSNVRYGRIENVNYKEWSIGPSARISSPVPLGHRLTEERMRRPLTLSLVLALLVILPVTSASAGDETATLDVVITNVDVPELLSGMGTFTVAGEAAEYLCSSGAWETTVTFFEWLDPLENTTFDIEADQDFTCETGQTFVLNLVNRIVIGQGGLPGFGKWTWGGSTGFDPAPINGMGDILAGALGEVYQGSLGFDSDDDGVLDGVDVCSGTVLPDEPTRGLKGARFAAQEDGNFDSGLDRFDGRYTLVDTHGCSGTQIIEIDGLGAGHTRFGISKSALEAFIANNSNGV